MFSNLTSQVSNLWGKKPEEGEEGSVGTTEEKVASPVIEDSDPNLDGAAKADGSPTKGGSKIEMLTNVKSQMSSWLGAGTGLGSGLISAVKGRASGEETVPDPPAHLVEPKVPTPTDPPATSTGIEEDENSSATEGADTDPQVSENEGEAGGEPVTGAANKVTQGAKTFGSFLYSAVNKAGAKVSEASAKIKKTVGENTLLGEFNKEQEAFIKGKQTSLEAAVPPWVGYPNEEKIKEEILSLSQDRRSFVRAPPTGVTFEFDHESFTPVAQALLAEDPELEKMRFELVPKVVNEETFWRNYFYRVSLIKQSYELPSFVCEGNVNSSLDDGSTATTLTPNPPTNEHSALVSTTNQSEVSEVNSTNHEAAFASDETVSSEQERFEALQELRRLGVADEAPAAAEWEKELQAELKDFEVVPGGRASNNDNWENDVQNLLDDETDLK